MTLPLGNPILDLIKAILKRTQKTKELIASAPNIHGLLLAPTPSPLLTKDELLFLTGPEPNQAIALNCREKHKKAIDKLGGIPADIAKYFETHLHLNIANKTLEEVAIDEIIDDLLSFIDPVYDLNDIGMFTICDNLIAQEPSEHLDPFYLTLLTLKLHEILKDSQTFAKHSVFLNPSCAIFLVFHQKGDQRLYLGQ